MLSEEEQETIEKLKDNFILTKSEQNIISNYIEKLQKENKELNKTIEQLENTIVELSTAMEE